MIARPTFTLFVACATLAAAFSAMPAAAAPCYSDFAQTAARCGASATETTTRLLFCESSFTCYSVSSFGSDEATAGSETVGCIQRIPIGTHRCTETYMKNQSCTNADKLAKGLWFTAMFTQSWASASSAPIPAPTPMAPTCHGTSILITDMLA